VFELKEGGTLQFAFSRHVPLFLRSNTMLASQSTPAAFLFITWGVTTVVLVALLSYRATLSSHGDQKFSDPAKQDHNQVEKAVIAKRSLLTGEIIVLSVISAVLLFTCVGLSIY
jgi:hypothetical protein